MANAEVGDDVWGDDPTVIRLEQVAADKLGKEAALFLPSGTMGNLVALMSHCWERGAEAIVGHKSHIMIYEQGGIAQLAGILPKVLDNQPDGTIRLHDIEKGIQRSINDHYCCTQLLCLENTHNKCCGAALPVNYMDAAAAIAHEYGLKVHLDGARIFNAAVALEVDPKRLVENVDSLTFCLSKGLSCPVGSVLCGSEEFIQRARRVRKLVGGGLRQSGVLAAAGLYALDSLVDRLKDDHARAKRLANGLGTIPGLSVGTPNSNMVFFNINWALTSMRNIDEFMNSLSSCGISICEYTIGDWSFRAVLHSDVSDTQVTEALEKITTILTK